MPPASIEQLLEAPPTPVVRLSPDRKMMLVEQPATFPTIADVAQPRYRLAGIRFNPSSNGPSVERYDVALRLQSVGASAPKAITGLPAKLKAVDAPQLFASYLRELSIVVAAVDRIEK